MTWTQIAVTVGIWWACIFLICLFVFLAARNAKAIGRTAPPGWEDDTVEPESSTMAVRMGYVGGRCGHCLSYRVRAYSRNVHCIACDRVYAIPE